jgi:hypothetical protein
MRFSTALDGSLLVLWLYMPQTAYEKAVTSETTIESWILCQVRSRLSLAASTRLGMAFR